MILAYGLYAIYLSGLLVLLMIWLRPEKPSAYAQDISTSVIVPFRNEAENLPTLVKSLGTQTHADFEVVFVNDHSTDTSASILKSLLKEVSFSYHMVELDTTTGKKAAIDKGIGHASSALIVTTDADCFFNADWLRIMTMPFVDNELQMLAGPVALEGRTFWEKMQSVESSALIGTGGAMLKMGVPLMANGANLAYRKKAFQAVNGFEGIDSIPSGDDELLMAKIAREFRGGVRFLQSNLATVKTTAEGTWAGFRQQRLRWAGKWNIGKRPWTKLMALFIFAIQLAQVFLLAQLFTTSESWKLTSLFLFAKASIEWFFIAKVRKSFGQKIFLGAFLINYLLYPFYAIYFGIAANFGKYQWKNREFSR